MKKIHVLLLAMIVAAGFALRIAGITFGLPTSTRTLATYHPDESIHLYSLEKIRPLQLEFYPGDALYWGSFHFYLQGALTKALQVTGAVQLGGREFFLSHLQEADKLYVIGRMISVVLGTASILVFFLIARRLYGMTGGMIGALLLAFAPLAVTTSFYAKPDGVMLFWFLLSVYFALRAVESRATKDYVLYGIFLGVAAASKYSGLISFGFFLLLHSVPVVKREYRFATLLRNSSIVMGMSLVSFVAVNPYSVIRSNDFWGYFTGIIASKTIMPGDMLSGYSDYITGILPAAIGWPAFALALLGIALLLNKMTFIEGAIAVFIAAFVLRFGPPRGQALTYCLPLVPFLLLMATKASTRLLLVRGGKIAVGLVVAYTLLYSISYKRLYYSPDIRVEASRWIEEHIPVSSVIAVSKSDFWTPPVLKGGKSRFNVIYGKPPQSPMRPAIIALGDAAKKADYVVLTSDEYYEYFRYPGDYPAEYNVVKGIMEKDFETVTSFEKHARVFGIPFYREYVTLDWMFPNPKILVLKRRPQV